MRRRKRAVWLAYVGVAAGAFAALAGWGSGLSQGAWFGCAVVILAAGFALAWWLERSRGQALTVG